MLSDIRCQSAQAPVLSDNCSIRSDDRYSRNMQDDMKEAIDLLFKFKSGLDKLNPECTRIIEKMLAHLPQRY